jgi:hypothetical protein
LVRRPAVNTGFDNYYGNQLPFRRELELDRLDKERARRYCIFDNTLLIFSAKQNRWLCDRCGWSPSDAEDSGVITNPQTEQQSEFLETSRHMRTNPGGKHPDQLTKVQEDYASSVMRLRPLGGSSSGSRSRGRKKPGEQALPDSDSERMKYKGHSLVAEWDITQTSGTMSAEELAKEKARQRLVR